MEKDKKEAEESLRLSERLEQDRKIKDIQLLDQEIKIMFNHIDKSVERKKNKIYLFPLHSSRKEIGTANMHGDIYWVYCTDTNFESIKEEVKKEDLSL